MGCDVGLIRKYCTHRLNDERYGANNECDNVDESTHSDYIEEIGVE
jgi:hypothetical protein